MTGTQELKENQKLLISNLKYQLFEDANQKDLAQKESIEQKVDQLKEDLTKDIKDELQTQQRILINDLAQINAMQIKKEAENITKCNMEKRGYSQIAFCRKKPNSHQNHRPFPSGSQR